jgi:pimeloyl-ACP methyl ester carboxylesterase
MSSAATKTVRSEDGTTIAYDRVGAGPAVTVVGGGPTDRLANAPLAALLADRFTVYSYDRRGRGESGAAEAYAVERECEDLGAVIAAAGGVAAAFGTSSGAVLTLEAASRGVSLSSLVLWEPSYVVDDSRTPPPAGLADSVAELVAAGRNGDALELFFTGAVDMPAEAVAYMRSQRFWEDMEATAPALVHDITLMGDFSLPADRLGSVSAPTLVVDGGTTPWLTASADAVAAAVPGAVRQTIAGQPHNVDPSAIAPVIADWLSNAAAATDGA